MVARWLDDGYDVVYTAKANRENEPWLRRTGVHWFYALINWGQRQQIPEDAGDFRLLSPRAAAALRQMAERNRFFKGMSNWIGFRQVRVDYEPAPRAYGATSWNVWSLIGLSIEGLTSFTVAPLRVASLLGLLLAATALLFGGWILLQTLLFGQDVPGYPSLVVGLMVLGGVQLLMIGVLGEYIGKMLSEVKARPVYFVAEHSLKRADELRVRRRHRARRSEPLPTHHAPRRIWLCADDYGISPGVNAAIRELILRGRLNATSVMTAAPHLGNDEADALEMLNSGEKRAAIGLHVTLTAPFSPLSADYAPLRDGAFLPLNETMRLAVARRLQSERLIIEIASQLRAFVAAFGHLPDFVDGHQHVHLFPQVRDALLKVVAETAPMAWVRQCGRARWRARAARPQGTGPRYFKSGVSPQSAAAGHRRQPGLCRRL